MAENYDIRRGGNGKSFYRSKQLRSKCEILKRARQLMQAIENPANIFFFIQAGQKNCHGSAFRHSGIIQGKTARLPATELYYGK